MSGKVEDYVGLTEAEELNFGVLNITDPKYRFSALGLKLSFLLMIFNCIATNTDHGAIPQATVNIKQDLAIDNA